MVTLVTFNPNTEPPTLNRMLKRATIVAKDTKVANRKTHKTFKRYCETCDELFRPTGKFQRYCEKCRYLKNSRRWRKYGETK